jgi:hypothetical protein
MVPDRSVWRPSPAQIVRRSSASIVLLLVGAMMSISLLVEAGGLHETWSPGLFDDASPIETPAVSLEIPALSATVAQLSRPVVFILGSVPPGCDGGLSASCPRTSRTRAPPLG